MFNDVFCFVGESKSVIPPTQAFYLTTNARKVPSAPAASAPAGMTDGSYFDKPAVKESLLAQQVIQVPEYKTLQEDDAVAGRLRTRQDEVRVLLYCIWDVC